MMCKASFAYFARNAHTVVVGGGANIVQGTQIGLSKYAAGLAVPTVTIFDQLLMSSSPKSSLHVIPFNLLVCSVVTKMTSSLRQVEVR